MTALASVAVPLPHVDLLTYRIPAHLDVPVTGARVLVPVGVLAVSVFCVANIGRGATHAGISIRMFRAGTIAGPVAITSGPDGAVWFTNERARSVGRITSSGSITVRAASGVSASPGAITAGRDGALWFVDGGDKIARLSPGGALTEFPVPSAFDIAATSRA